MAMEMEETGVRVMGPEQQAGMEALEVPVVATAALAALAAMGMEPKEGSAWAGLAAEVATEAGLKGTVDLAALAAAGARLGIRALMVEPAVPVAKPASMATAEMVAPEDLAAAVPCRARAAPQVRVERG